MITIEFYRQGDVGFRAIEVLPEGLNDYTSPVLVEGEVTGHAHRIETMDTVRILIAASMLMYLQVVRPTRIVHEEHGPITLPPGNYQIIRQREYSPEEIRMVID